MKRIGVLGGMSPQATIDFEARVHAICQERIPQAWNSGYPPMLVWYHRHLPMRFSDDGLPIVPMQTDPRLLEAAAHLGTWADVIVMPCNSAHIALRELTDAAGCPVLSMIDATIDEVVRRGWTTVGVLGFNGAPSLYLDPLHARGIVCETIDRELQTRLDAGIRAVMEGREGPDDAQYARTAIAALRAKDVEGTILGCTEVPLLLADAAGAPDLINPSHLLAEAAVSYAIGVDMPATPLGVTA
jgi:aspartate racemase